MAQTLSFDEARTVVDEVAQRDTRSDLASPRAVLSLASCLIVCALVVVSVQAFRGPSPISVLWFGSAVAVAGWLNGPRGREFNLAYPLLTAAAFSIGGLLVGNSAYETSLFSGACLVEVILAVWLIRRFIPVAQSGSLAGLIKFLLVVPILAPLLPGLGVAGAIAAQTHRPFINLFACWELGHGLGMAVVVPLGLYVARGDHIHLPKLTKLFETVVILGGVTVVSVLVFYGDHRPIGFMTVPMLLLAAARLRLPGAAAALLITSVFALNGVLSGSVLIRPDFPDTIEQRIRLMQLYLVFSALPALPMAALLDERDRLAAAARSGQAVAEAASAGKSRLLANVSHEIKSPVAGIIGIGELWSNGRLGGVTPMQQEMAEMLVRTARQVEALAYDLLDVSQAEAGKITVRLTQVDVSGLLEDVRRTLAMRPEAASVRIQVEGAGDPVLTMADSVRLTQVVTNLASNAIKYGGAGGVVILRLDQGQSGRVRISVIDRGPGIPLAKQAELFEPFNRLGMEKTAIEGNGIGLALARRLTELQGGTIGFESRPGEGSRFWVELPGA